MRLGGDPQAAWQGRAHFFGAAAEAMRRILIDRARKRAVRQASGLAALEELDEPQLEIQAPAKKYWRWRRKAPGIKRRVIAGRYLTPWQESLFAAHLQRYWREAEEL